MQVIYTHPMFSLQVNLELESFSSFSLIQQGFHAFISKEKLIVLDLKCMFIQLQSILEKANRISVCPRYFWFWFWFCAGGRVC